MVRFLSLIAIAALGLAGCRSPFGMSGPAEEDPEVGRGVHGWPFLEVAYEGKGTRTDIFWPLCSVFSGDDGGNSRAEFLFPILHWSKEGGTKRYAFRPIFDLEIDETTTDLDALWPLFKWRSGPDETDFDLLRIFPLYGREVRDDLDRLSVGIVYHRKESPPESYLWLLPLYGETRTGARSSTWVLPPLFYGTTDGEAGRVDYGLPWPLFLYGASTGPEDDYLSLDLLWPLLHYEREGGVTTARALPILWQRTGPDSTDRVVFPFWWQFDDPEGSFQMLFPVYGRQTRGEDFDRTILGGPLLILTRDGAGSATDVLWPFFHVGSGEDGWDARAFPILWLEREEDRSVTHLWPLFGHERRKDVDEYFTLAPFFRCLTGEGRFEIDFPAPIFTYEEWPNGHDLLLFPFFSSERNGGAREGSVLWKLANWESQEAGETSDFRILWRLVQVTEGEHKSTFVVNPFFRHEENDRGDSYWSALFGLLARKESDGEVDWRILWIF